MLYLRNQVASPKLSAQPASSEDTFTSGGLMNILLVGGDVKVQAENLNALQLAFGQETGLKLASLFSDVRRELQSGQYHVVLDLGLPVETRWRLLRLARQLDPLTSITSKRRTHPRPPMSSLFGIS